MNETQATYYGYAASTQEALDLQNAFKAVRARAYIVGSLSEDGTFSISEKPVTHPNLPTAKGEAHRLARLKPGTSFIVMNLVAGAVVPRVHGVAEF